MTKSLELPLYWTQMQNKGVILMMKPTQYEIRCGLVSFILLILIVIVALIVGCEINRPSHAGQILGDPEKIVMVKVQKGCVVTGVRVKEDGVYITDEAFKVFLKMSYDVGLMKGYEDGYGAIKGGNKW